MKQNKSLLNTMLTPKELTPLQKLSTRINALMFAFLGGWAGYCGYDVYLYFQDPDIYLSQSAPWYTNILLYSGVTAGVVVLCLVAKFAIKRLDQNGNR